MMKSFLSDFNVSEIESIINITLSTLTVFIALYNILKKAIAENRVKNKMKNIIEEKELKILKDTVDQLSLTDIKKIKEYKKLTLFSQVRKEELSLEALDVLKVIDTMERNNFIDNLIYFIFHLEYQFLIKMEKTGRSLRDTDSIFKQMAGDFIRPFTYILNVVIKIVRSIAKIIFWIFILVAFITIFFGGIFVVYMIFKDIITPFIVSFYLSALPIFLKIIITTIVVAALVIAEPKRKEK